MVLNVHKKNIRFIRDGRRGKGVLRWGKREIIHLLLHCYNQNDPCIKMGSDESHFNVSLIVRDKVTRQCPQTTTFEEKGEPKRIRTEVPLLTSLTARPNRRTLNEMCLTKIWSTVGHASRASGTYLPTYLPTLLVTLGETQSATISRVITFTCHLSLLGQCPRS